MSDNVSGVKMSLEEVVATIQDYDKNLKGYKQHNFDEFLPSNQSMRCQCRCAPGCSYEKYDKPNC